MKINKQLINKLIEVICVISIFYMVISLINSVYAIKGLNASVSAYNQIRIMVWSSVAAMVIYSHHLFARWSPLMMILLQYITAVVLIVLVIYLEGVVRGITMEGYVGGILNFTIPYAIGAVIYYLSLYYGARRQNELIQDLKK